MLPISETDPVTDHAHVDAGDFKKAVGAFATGVTIITTATPTGASGCTASSFTSLSLDPPLVLVCLDRRTPMRDYIDKAGRFGINVLAADQPHLSQHFARWSPDKFADIDHDIDEYGVPLLVGAISRLSCTLDRSYYGGDHVILVGRVEHIDLADGEPLVYHMARYHRLVPHPGS